MALTIWSVIMPMALASPEPERVASLLLYHAAIAAAYVGWPRGEGDFLDASEADRLRERRAALLVDLAELDSDLAEGRISDDDRRTGRRARRRCRRPLSGSRSGRCLRNG